MKKIKKKLKEVNERLENIDPSILPDDLFEEVELTPSQMIQQIQVKAFQSGGTFTLANGNAVATSLGYVTEFGKEDVCMTDATYEDYGNFDDTDIENMYHTIF